MTVLKGLKIPVSAVRFRLWALENRAFRWWQASRQVRPVRSFRQTVASRWPAVLAVLATTSMATGCAVPVGHADPAVYHADASFTPDERAEIAKSVGLLSSVTGHRLSVVFDGATADYTITREDGHHGGCNEMHSHSQHIYVGTGDTGFRPERSTAAQDVATIVAHELTHGLGMVEHVKDPGALMAPVWSPGGFKWTAADQTYCEESGVCT